MFRARVVGEVWATKKCPGLKDRKLLILARMGKSEGSGGDLSGERSPSGQVLVAIDQLDSRIGEDVVVTFGSGARNAVRPGATTNYDLMIDAALVQITDRCSSDE